MATDEVGAAYHAAAQQADLDHAVQVTGDVVLPALAAMSAALGRIERWPPGRAFAVHGLPLVTDFNSAADEFLENPTAETFEPTDVAGQTLRDELFAGTFARVGRDLFHADCR